MGRLRKHADNANKQAAYRQRTRRAAQEQQKAKGLPALPAIPTVPGWGRWIQAMAHAEELVEQTQREMQAYFDERTEQWQESDRGQEFQQRFGRLDEAIEAISAWRD